MVPDGTIPDGGIEGPLYGCECREVVDVSEAAALEHVRKPERLTKLVI